MSVFGVIMVCISLHSDWIRRDAEYLSVFSPNAGKCGPEKPPYLDTFHAVFISLLIIWSDKLNKIFYVSNWFLFYLSAAYFQFQLYLVFIFSLSINLMFLLLHASLKWHSHLNYHFGKQVQKPSCCYFLSCIGDFILVCY